MYDNETIQEVNERQSKLEKRMTELENTFKPIAVLILMFASAGFVYLTLVIIKAIVNWVIS